MDNQEDEDPPLAGDKLDALEATIKELRATLESEAISYGELLLIDCLYDQLPE
jgi:hypothetical protein